MSTTLVRDQLDLIKKHLQSTSPTEDEKNDFLKAFKALDEIVHNGNMPFLYAARARELYPRAKKLKLTYEASFVQDFVKSTGQKSPHDDATLKGLLNFMHEANRR